LEHFFCPYIGNFIIPTDSYFSEGWLNHQQDLVGIPFPRGYQVAHEWNDLVVGVATAAGCSKVCTNMFLPGSISHFLGSYVGYIFRLAVWNMNFIIPYIGNNNPN
jgi:hypothetical protein